MLKLSNTLTGTQEPFVSLQPGQVKMYVCGITPYDYPHVGHGRVYVTFDLLFRLLPLYNYTVTYCRNFTDIDDKLLNRAEKELGDKLLYATIANKFIDAFHVDMKMLGCLPPTYEPRVTEHIPEIISFIEQLIKKGAAYRVNGDVYFNIATFDHYAQLSKHNLADLRAGTRVEINEKKRDPLDFALWKSEAEGTFWKSPWGYGRPGWHIECSVLASIFLGKQIDIHGGGMDLIFPHHDNEIAQTESYTGLPFARYWVHNAFVRINKEKMSKSLGNFFTLQQVFQQFDPMLVRFYYLNHHYRTPLDFSFDDLEALRKPYQKLVRALQPTATAEKTAVALEHPIVKRMVDFLNDDLNSPGMLGVLFAELETIAANDLLRNSCRYLVTTILGLSLQPLPEKTSTITPEIQQLIDKRELARQQKDWKKADELRDQLKELGIEVQDKKS